MNPLAHSHLLHNDDDFSNNPEKLALCNRSLVIDFLTAASNVSTAHRYYYEQDVISHTCPPSLCVLLAGQQQQSSERLGVSTPLHLL